MFKDWKVFETMTNHRWIVEELLVRRDQERMTKRDHPTIDRSGDRNGKLMSRARAVRPFSKIPLPNHLTKKYRGQFDAYVEHRLKKSKFGFSSQKGDWAASGADDTIFAVNGESVREAYSSPASSYPSPEEEVSRPKCASQPGPSAAWFRAAWLSDGGTRFDDLKVPVLKSFLYWSGKAMGSSAADVLRRVRVHLESKYGAPLSRDAAQALDDELESGAISMRSVLRPGQEGSEDAGMVGSDDDPSGRLLLDDDGEGSDSDKTNDEEEDEKVIDWKSATPMTHKLKELQGGYDRMKNKKKVPHPTVPSRRNIKFAYRVLHNRDSIEVGCFPPSGADEWPEDEDGIKESNRRHVRGQHAAQTAAVSMTLDFTWALFFATKGIWHGDFEGEKRVIVEINLEELEREGRPIVDVSTYRSAHCNGLTKYPQDIWAKSASEVLTSGIPPTCLSGQTWELCSTGDGYMRLLAIHPSQGRTLDKKGGVDKFGGYGHWFKAFHDELSLAEEKALVNGLRTGSRRTIGVVSGPRKRTKTIRGAAQAAATTDRRST